MHYKSLTIPFEIKEDVENSGEFSGYGAVFKNVDSYRDVIVPGAFKETLEGKGRNKNGVVMLMQHGRNDATPIGVWPELSENSKGLKVKGQLAMKTQRGAEAHELLKMKAINGLSIGWDFMRDSKGNIRKDAVDFDEKKDIRYLKKIDLWEISLVAFPANQRATVTSVKNILKTATTIRELEALLRDEGQTSHEAKATIARLRSLFLQEPGRSNEQDQAEQLLETLKGVSENLKQGE